MILLSGSSKIGTSDVRGGLAIGTGKTAPIESNSELEQLIASTANETDEFYWYDDNPFRVTHSKVYGFAGSTGYLFTEAGIGGSFTELFSRSLIPDGNGNETTIKINDDETLRVVHSVTFVPPEEDYVWQAEINGVTHTFTLRSCQLGNQTTWRNINGPCAVSQVTFASAITLGPNIGVPIIGGETEVLGPISALDSSKGPSFELVANTGEAAFVDGIAGADFTTTGIDGRYQLKINPPIQKTVDDRLTISIPLELL